MSHDVEMRIASLLKSHRRLQRTTVLLGLSFVLVILLAATQPDLLPHDTVLSGNLTVTGTLTCKAVQTDELTPSKELVVKGGLSVDSLKLNGHSLFNNPPIGSVVGWSGALPPIESGWIECDGRVLPVTEFPELHTVLGETYGNAPVKDKQGEFKDGFAIPNYRGYFLRGVDAEGIVDSERKDHVVGSVQLDQIQQHRHTGKWHQAGQDDHGIKFANSEYPVSPDEEGHTDFQTGNVIAVPSVPARAGGETRPINTSIYYIIRAK